MDVSVIVATRDRSAFLATALRSALGQQELDFEVIVVDDASIDDTGVVLAAIGDARLRVIRHVAPRGLAAARNHGAAESRGEWLAFLDDDDLWAPDKLARQLDAARRADRDWVYTGSVNFIDDCRITYSGRPLPPEQTVAALPRYNVVPGGGSNVVWRRATWQQVGPFDIRFEGGEDWDMSIRLAKHGPPAWVCSPLMAKRVHARNMFSDVELIVRATKLIEVLHKTEADWGRVHRWLADRHLRRGERGAALGHFARAAVRGQLRGVVSDLSAIGQLRLQGIVQPDSQSALSRDPWRTAAAAWLCRFEGIHAAIAPAATTLQKICGWCRKNISPGAQPATYGICATCFVLVRADMDATKGGA